MHQLDLFGSLFNTVPAQNKTGDNQLLLKKEEEVSSASGIEDAPFSLVGLAEETLGGNAFNGQSEVNKTSSFDSTSAKQPEEKSLSCFEGEIINGRLSEAIKVEETKIYQKSSIQVEYADVEEKAVEQIQREVSLPKNERNGTVIFDDGKISVKVKSKTITPVPDPVPAVVTIEKTRKEPQKRGRKPIKEIEAEADLIEVPEDEVLFQKQYYPISEVAKWFRVNTSLLRFWENEFDILKPRKNRKGDRLFRPEDVKNLQLIYQLLRQRKYTIEGAKEYIKTNRKKADIELQLTNSLQKFKSFLLDLKANLQ